MTASDDTAPPDSPRSLDQILVSLASLDDRVAALDERARHREAVIDRLHAENRELRAGQDRTLFDPVVTDLVHLHDQLAREAHGLRERGQTRLADLLAGFADDTLLSLERLGVEPVDADVGDPFRADLHRPLATVDHPDPARDGTVAEVAAPGFRDTVTGRIRRRVHARFFRHVGPVSPEGAATPGKGS
ncbi:nucleotide exchange factor GrpE [Nocardiopsis protaetiae]|uniref:nucleotide exchange factor GrpE n=1 Tax=Nocardiopsis protaetiae TaxID=3382270 RepID=UPI00387ACC06